ncbi:bifunctional Pyridoxal phosphate-dependent transferase [Babesia duncani]|uniref:cysteine desulfurase n=1 Tax=Babesia duncani TaxID=323732 RepID=A0AAD9PMK9_9APIC|nr:bifunctional Pyridoxal phosphate-dependent transferase [Babesia duncani]
MQKPKCVIDKYEQARENIAKFVNASTNEIVFTSGATESINLVAYSWGDSLIQESDTILLTLSEHNSNIIPWQMLSKRKRCKCEFIKLNPDGSIDIKHCKELLQRNSVKLLSISHASNVLGRIQDLQKIIKLAHDHNSLVLVDACQTLGHIPVDVKKINCDFLVGSGHKIYGPTGVGFLFAKKEHLDLLEPWKGGGLMNKEVKLHDFKSEDIPHKFEAGTPQIAQAIGLSAAIDFLNGVGLDNIVKHESELTQYTYQRLKTIATIVGFDGCANDHLPIFTFYVNGLNSFDLSSMLASKGFCVRSGMHCSNILHENYIKANSTVRMSMAMYSGLDDIDKFIAALETVSSQLKLNCPTAKGIGGDSILKVDGKLVTPKYLSKALLKCARMDLTRQHMEYILISCVHQMPQAIDDVNVTLILSTMLKLNIKSHRLIDHLIPLCYSINDFQRLVAIAHMIAMIFGNNVSESTRAFIAHIAQQLPLHYSGVNLKSIGRLCEAMSLCNVYSVEFGSFLLWLLKDELTIEAVSDEPSHFASIILCLGRMSLGNENIWRFYKQLTMSIANVTARPGDLLKILEAFMHRGLRNDQILRTIGDALADQIYNLHPDQVTGLTGIYMFFEYKHTRLFSSIFDSMEMLLSQARRIDTIQLIAFCLECKRNNMQLKQRPLKLLFQKSATNVLHHNISEKALILKAMQSFNIQCTGHQKLIA